MYYVFLDKTPLPVPPSKMDVKISGKDKTYTLMNEGEISVLKQAGLTEVSFNFVLPNQRYPFAYYPDGFHDAKWYLDQIERLKIEKTAFQFIVVRQLNDNIKLAATNLKVTIDDYTVTDTTDEGTDMAVSIKLRQYRSYGTKLIQVISPPQAAPVAVEPPPPRPAENPPTQKTYTVRDGDCLWNIAKREYGDGSRYVDIFNANTDQIEDPNLIYTGQVLVIP